MFRHVAGLEIPESVPGCRHMDFRPSLNWELREQETVYDSPAGEYRSAWKILDASHVEMRFTVPFGCTATLVLPQAEGNAYEGIGEMRDGVCRLTSGSYEVRYETVCSLKPSCSIRSTIREGEPTGLGGAEPAVSHGADSGAVYRHVSAGGGGKVRQHPAGADGAAGCVDWKSLILI